MSGAILMLRVVRAILPVVCVWRPDVLPDETNVRGARGAAEVAPGELEGAERERDGEGDPEGAVRDPEQDALHHAATVVANGLIGG